jgi:hypothetical protein
MVKAINAPRLGPFEQKTVRIVQKMVKRGLTIPDEWLYFKPTALLEPFAPLGAMPYRNWSRD